MYVNCWLVVSWSSGRVQDSGSRPSPGFNTLPVHWLVVPLSKALHAALLFLTQEQMSTCEGRFVSHGIKLHVSGCILPRELRWISRWIYTDRTRPFTREGTCQSQQSRAQRLDVDSKHFTFLAASWSSGRVQDSGLGSRSSLSWIPCRCVCSLCPWPKHCMLQTFSRPRSEWVPVRTDL